MTIERRTINMNDARMLRCSHESGLSVLALSRIHRIARRSIVARIKAAGGIVRNRSTANTERMKREGKAGRKRLTEAAHLARRGIKIDNSELLKRANARSRLVGYGEAEIKNALDAAGVPTEVQRPCGKYNIDIAIGPSIAVEIVTQGNFRPTNPKFFNRIKYLSNSGYCIICVTFRHNRLDDMIGNLDDIIAFVKRSYRSPALKRKNWMIRCGSKRFSRIRNNLGQLAAIPTPIRFFHIRRELYPS